MARRNCLERARIALGGLGSRAQAAVQPAAPFARDGPFAAERTALMTHPALPPYEGSAPLGRDAATLLWRSFCPVVSGLDNDILS
jgi:hypothetical protein